MTADRRAVVIGGSRGIGRAIVERLARDGVHVVASGRDAAALDRLRDHLCADGLDVATVVADATDEAATQALAHEANDVDVLVVNAGVSSAAPLRRTSLASWEQQLRVNATGAFLALRAFVPGMVDRGHGRAVVIASTAAVSGGPYLSGYAAAKHAVQGLVRSVAAEVAGSGVTVNTVCPHFVRTDMTDETVQRITGATGRSRAQAIAALERTSRLGRLIEPDEVAGVVALLLGDDAAVLNGQTLLLDGGHHW